MRPRVVLALARRDLARARAGRGAVSGALLLLGLLGLAGSVPLPGAAAGAPLPAAVRGELPAPLAGDLALDPGSPVRLEAGPPVRAHGPVPPAVRAALDRLPGEPAVQRRITRAAGPPVGRGLPIALLLLSMIVAPTASSLTEERAEGTLEALLAAAVGPGEVLTGKWLAWSGAATVGLLLAALGGALTGAWSAPLGFGAAPAAVAAGVAAALWIGRRGSDPISQAATQLGATVALVAALWGAAEAAAAWAPAAGALVPLGGALMVAGERLPGALLPVAVASSLGGAAAALGLAARGLSASPRPPAPAGPAPAATLAAAGWALALGASGALAAHRGLPAAPDPLDARALAGALPLLLAALLLWARAAPAPPWGLDLRRVGEAMGAGALLGVGLPGLARLSLGGPAAEALAAPLATGLLQAPPGPGVALAIVAQEALFRGPALRARPALSVALWTLATTPTRPLVGLASGVALVVLARRGGGSAALAARLGLLAGLMLW